MLYTYLFWTVIVILCVIGYRLITQNLIKKRRRIVFRRFYISDIQDYVTNVESKHNLKDFFRQTSLSLSVSQYITIRLLILALLAIAIFVYVILTGDSPLMLALLYILFCYITLPRYTFLGINTPFSVFIKYLRINYLKNVKFELFRIITVLKNLIITCKDKPLSAEYIINNLIEFSSLTKPIFTEFLSLYRLNRIDEAYSYFVSEVGEDIGEEFASLLIKLDDIDPLNLIQQLELYQETIRDSYMTERIKRDKFISDLVFIPIIASVFLILLNFVMISIYIDGINSFNLLFE